MSQPIQCPSCGYENDATRIFCHNCGVRLPRTEEQIKEKAEQNRQATEEAKKVLRKGHKRAKQRSFKDLLASAVHSLITVAIYAAFAAAVILAFRAPDHLPPPGAPNIQLIQAGEKQIANASRPGFQGTISTSQEQINDYLASKNIIQSRAGFGLLNAEIQRLFVVLEQGDFVLGLEYSLMGIPVFLTTTFGIIGPSGDFSLEVLHGSIGRLPVHPNLFERFLRWYAPIAEAMHGQLKILSEAESISITPGDIKIIWARAQKPAPKQPPQAPEFSAPKLPVTPRTLRLLDES